MVHSTLLLQAAGGNANILNLVMIGGIFVVMYFFMIRPQQKRQKEQQAFTDSMEKGSQVVTAGGMHGKIVNIVGTTVTLEISRGVMIKVEKDFISKELSARNTDTDEAKA
jgi:preprotein translocase subunit YajC